MVKFNPLNPASPFQVQDHRPALHISFRLFTFLFWIVLNKTPTSVEFSFASGLSEDMCENMDWNSSRSLREFLWIAGAGTWTHSALGLYRVTWCLIIQCDLFPFSMQYPFKCSLRSASPLLTGSFVISLMAGCCTTLFCHVEAQLTEWGTDLGGRGSVTGTRPRPLPVIGSWKKRSNNAEIKLRRPRFICVELSSRLDDIWMIHRGTAVSDEQLFLKYKYIFLKC